MDKYMLALRLSLAEIAEFAWFIHDASQSQGVVITHRVEQNRPALAETSVSPMRFCRTCKTAASFTIPNGNRLYGNKPSIARCKGCNNWLQTPNRARRRISEEKKAKTGAKGVEAQDLRQYLKVWTGMLKEDKYHCRGCRRPYSGTRLPTVDHVVPMKGPGSKHNEISNLQPLCSACNTRKQKLPWEIFRLRMIPPIIAKPSSGSYRNDLAPIRPCIKGPAQDGKTFQLGYFHEYSPTPVLRRPLLGVSGPLYWQTSQDSAELN